MDRAAKYVLIESIEEGDLIRLNGTLRVVRHVSPSYRKCHKQYKVKCVTLSILRCSWTTKAYTVRSRYDLAQCSIEIVKKNYGTQRCGIEVQLQLEIDNHHVPQLLNCCDVIGVIS